MNTEILTECQKTADKIINILTELGYTTESKPTYKNLLKDLLVIEIKNNVNSVVELFYNNAAVVPMEKEEDEVASPV